MRVEDVSTSEALVDLASSLEDLDDQLIIDCRQYGDVKSLVKDVKPMAKLLKHASVLQIWLPNTVNENELV